MKKNNETQYVGSENVTSFCEMGTREEWYDVFLNCDHWYNEAIIREEFDGTIEDYANFLCDTELSEWDGDESYKPM